LLGAAEENRKASGAPVAAVDVRRYAQLVSRVKSHLGEDAFTTDWAAGCDMPIDSAMDLALHVALTDGAATQAAPVDETSVLSPRQGVVRLMCAAGAEDVPGGRWVAD
jgi:hypothetical protein